MNLAAVDKIAKAVLYEGYMLYPYRPSSVKNQQRWNFGVLCPESYSKLQQGNDAWTMQTECLVAGHSGTLPEIRVRFLQLVSRSVGEFEATNEQPGRVPQFHFVNKLEVGGRLYQPWQEAVEREVRFPECSLESLDRAPVSHWFTFPADKQTEFLTDGEGRAVGFLEREQRELHGVVEVRVERIGEGIFKIGVSIRNLTSLSSQQPTRDQALLSSLVSTHTVLGLREGKFYSLLAPPEHLTAHAAACNNVGTWPVLVGDEGQCDTILSSPIILYDYPQIAPESSGDLFDGTEIDEILSLRIMTLTDEEKREMRQSDERARQMLERTESMPAEQFMKLHGVLRNLRPLKEEAR
jgi:hypothetical protein